MADERVCYAGDLTSGNVTREVTVHVPPVGDEQAVDLIGELLEVSHRKSGVTGKPVTYVLLGTPPAAVGYVLDEHWKVTVR